MIPIGDTLGRAASRGPLAPEPPRATRSQPESMRIVLFSNKFFILVKLFFP